MGCPGSFGVVEARVVRDGATTCSSCRHPVPVEIHDGEPRRVWHWPWGDAIAGVGTVPTPVANRRRRGIAEGRP